jgi:hypothetical protein
MVGTDKIQDIDKAKVILPNTEQKSDTVEDNTVWIECMVKPTPKGFTIWIPKGAFK